MHIERHVLSFFLNLVYSTKFKKVISITYDKENQIDFY